jgi:Tol biopolymer transport system component
MRYLCFFGIFFCALQTIVCQQAQRLFTEAVYTEEVNGDLEKAIQQYSTIIKNFPGERPVAAQALLRLGMANEKLGKKQASTYYQQIISQYADQTEQVASARKRLERLKTDTEHAGIPPGPKFVTHIKLAELSDIYGQVSPDGRFISYVNWKHGNLAIYDIHTGASEDVTNEGTWDGKAAFADMSVWSPDNTQIAYTWFRGQDAEFRIYDVLNKQSRILIAQRSVYAPFPYQWTNQGKILIHYSDKNSVHKGLYFVDTKTGELQHIRDFGDGQDMPRLRGGSVSPDGRFFSITLKYADRPLETQIYSMDNLAGTPLAVLTQIDFDPVWSADGTHLYYTSTRHDSKALYKRRITDGIPAEQDEIILESVDIFIPSNVNPQTGDLYYLGGMQNTMILRTALDWNQRKFGTPELILSSDKGRWGPVFSPDGKRIVYCKRGTPGIPGNYICIRDLDTGAELDYDLRLRNLEQPIGHTQMQWTPDGKYVAVTYAPVDTTGRVVYRMAFVDVASGDVHKVPDLTVYRHRKAILSQSRLVNHERGSGLSIADLQSGKSTLVHAMPDSTVEAWFLSRSHDGRKIAYLEARQNDDFIAHNLNLLDLNSETIRTLWTLERPLGFAYRHAPLWLPDDRGLLLQITNTDLKTLQFYTYDLITGILEPFDIPFDAVKDRRYHATLSPDGKTMIYVREDRKTTAWVIQNID